MENQKSQISNRKSLNFDAFAKSRKTPFFVIPAKAGIQSF